MKILLLNQDWFKDELRSLGHTVVSCGADNHFEVRLKIPFLTISEVLELSGMNPDAIIIFDNSVPIFIRGLEELTIPILFYSVDAHHHIRFQRYYTQFFNGVLVAQKDYVESFRDKNTPVTWFPLWAPRIVEPATEKKHEVVFVGTMDRALNPERVDFFEALSKYVPLECLRGEYWNIFPQSKVVVNQTVKGDLNFRVFEALMCGSPLVTESTSNGLEDLFTDGVHLLTYKRSDVEDAARIIIDLLSDEAKRVAIGAQGRKAVLERHTASTRAQRLIEIIASQSSLSAPRRCFPFVANFVAFGLYIARENERQALRAFTEALSLIEKGLARHEELDFELAQELIGACRNFDKVSNLPRAQILIEKLRASYPDLYA